MRQITKAIVAAFLAKQSKSLDNTHSDGVTLFLHGNAIARWNAAGRLKITSAGWKTRTTKERLNALPGVSVYQKDREWYLNGKCWDGSWIEIS